MVRHPVVRPALQAVELASRLPEGVELQGQTLFLGARPGVPDLHADSSRVRHTRCFFSE